MLSPKSFANAPLKLGLPVAAISARVAGEYSPSAELRRRIASNWSETLARRPDQFDGSMCRLRNVEVRDGGADLNFERTSYAAYLGTRLPAALEGLAEERADPLGLTTLILTVDDQVLITRRSPNAEQNPNGLYFVGGYMEPPAEDGSIPFAAEVAREVKEEVGISLTADQIWLLGIGYDGDHCHPEAFFLAQTILTSVEVLAATQSAPDAAEAGRYLFIDRNELLRLNEDCVDSSTWSFRIGVGLLRMNAGGDQVGRGK
jgi:8-oxo-dGTP pyrophosphatase MutT (NUDIX family)